MVGIRVASNPMFTFATAITRLDGSLQPCFKAGSTSDQKVQRINEVLERFYELGSWRGLHVSIPLTTTAGIMTLPQAYQKIEGLGIPQSNQIIPIKPIEYLYQSGGVGPVDLTLLIQLIAYDLGDNVSTGLRQYQISGQTSQIDTYAFIGNARKRYVWTTDTATVIVPDSFQALRMGVLALGFEDEGDYEKCAEKFNEALRVLDGNLEEFEPNDKQVTIQRIFAGGQIAPLH